MSMYKVYKNMLLSILMVAPYYILFIYLFLWSWNFLNIFDLFHITPVHSDSDYIANLLK